MIDDVEKLFELEGSLRRHAIAYAEVKSWPNSKALRAAAIAFGSAAIEVNGVLAESDSPSLASARAERDHAIDELQRAKVRIAELETGGEI
jgi:hypothetical protein